MRHLVRRAAAVIIMGMSASTIALASPAQASDCHEAFVISRIGYCYQN
jgi:hypothetical protein